MKAAHPDLTSLGDSGQKDGYECNGHIEVLLQTLTLFRRPILDIVFEPPDDHSLGFSSNRKGVVGMTRWIYANFIYFQ